MAGFKNSILGGAETLIRSAIKSFNYVAGVAGWRITKAGSAEFNDATIRGTLIAGGGNVQVNSTGFHLDAVSVMQQFDINASAGFLARNLPDDGAYGKMVITGNGVSDGGCFFYNPTDPSVHGTAFDPGFVFGSYVVSGPTDIPYVLITSPNITGKVGSSIIAYGQSSTSAVDDSHVDITTSSFTVNGVKPGTVTQTVFTIPGSFTYTVPAHCNQVFVECIGGGGAGGGAPVTAAGQTSAGGGGGGGAYAAFLMPSTTVPANSPLTVGAGGSAVLGAAGNAGAASQFGSLPLVRAGGGGGGNIAGANTNFQNAQAGGGGVSTAGNILGGGTSGTWGARAGTTNGACFAGVGGASAIGGGGSGGNNTDGQAGHFGGAGGGGTCNNPSGANRFGGPGADGIIIITEYY